MVRVAGHKAAAVVSDSGSHVRAVRCTLDAPAACAKACGGASAQLLECELGRWEPGGLLRLLGARAPPALAALAGPDRSAGAGAARAPPAHGARDRRPRPGLLAAVLAPLLGPLAPAGWRLPSGGRSSHGGGGGAGAGAGGSTGGDALQPGAAPAAVGAAGGGGELGPRPCGCATGVKASGQGSVVEARGCAVAAWQACVASRHGGRVELSGCALHAAVGAGEWRTYSGRMQGVCASAEGRADVDAHWQDLQGQGDPSVVALHHCRLWAGVWASQARGAGRVEGLRSCRVRRWVRSALVLGMGGAAFAW